MLGERGNLWGGPSGPPPGLFFFFCISRISELVLSRFLETPIQVDDVELKKKCQMLLHSGIVPEDVDLYSTTPTEYKAIVDIVTHYCPKLHACERGGDIEE